MQQIRERCWIIHKRREPWVICPLCHQPITWRRIDVEGWSPCDEMPVLFVPGGRLRLVVRRDMVDGCKAFNPKKDRGNPKYGMIPHYYTCPVLITERKEWIKNKNGR